MNAASLSLLALIVGAAIGSFATLHLGDLLSQPTINVEIAMPSVASGNDRFGCLPIVRPAKSQ